MAEQIVKDHWNFQASCCQTSSYLVKNCLLILPLDSFLLSVLALGHLSLRWRHQSQGYHSSTDHELTLFFQTGFRDIKLVYNNLHVFKAYDLLSFGIHTYLQNHHHDHDSEYIHCPQKFPVVICNLSFLPLHAPSPLICCHHTLVCTF